MAPQFKSNKRPGQLVWISEHVLSFSHREGEVLPRPPPPLSPTLILKKSCHANPSPLNSTLFPIWSCRQIGYGKLLDPSSSSPPISRCLSVSLTHSRAVSSARGLPEQGSTRNELTISGNFEPHAHKVDSIVTRRFAHQQRILNVWKDAWRKSK